MIKGSFTSATGVIDIAFDDGLVAITPFDITQVGELSYSFDVTPESVTIDRLLALYSTFKFSFNGTNEVGTDVYEAMVDALFVANRDVTLTITTHDNEPFEFRYSAQINDLEYDERTGIASLLCKPKVNDLTFKQVFDAIDSNADPKLKVKYRKKTLTGEYVTYDATGVGTWIKTAMPLLFGGNSYPVDFVPSKSNLSSKYTTDLYTDATPLNTGDDKRILALVDMGVGFSTIETNDDVLPITGTISIGPATKPSSGDGIDVETEGGTKRKEITSTGLVEVRGTGTNFQASVLQGRKLFYYDGDEPVLVGIIVSVASTILLRIQLIGDSVNVTNARAGYSSGYLPNERPALEVLKELAGIEGSVFGCGFSRNFYINRLTDTQAPVVIDYDDVINAKLNRTNLYLGNSVVTQLGTLTNSVTNKVKKKKSFWEKLFGGQRYRNVTDPEPDDPYGTFPSTDNLVGNRQLPLLSRVTSGNVGNPRATKELRIELAPAYPLLSKGMVNYRTPGNVGQVTIYSDGVDVPTDTALESALTANGLRNYMRALSSVEGDFIVDFEIKGALKVKPYETFTFSNAPERYQGNVYRVSDIRYNLVKDTVKIKGYKINDIDIPVVPSAPLTQSIAFSDATLDFEWDTTKPVIASFDVLATGISGSLQLTCSAGFYSINTVPDDNLWRNSITLNTDGFGRVSTRIYVRFSPTASGIVSDSLLYGVIQASGGGLSGRVELRASVIAPQADFYIGIVEGIIGGNPVTSIACNMFTEIEQGREIALVGENKGNRYIITTAQDVATGESTFNIEEQFIERDRYHIEASQNADRTGITVSEKEIVLKVKSDGKIAAIRLSADADTATSEINIVADQVKINQVRFVSSDSNLANNAGYIESIPFTSGTTGWRINGLGNAEFANVLVRGTLQTSNIAGDLNMGPVGEIRGNGQTSDSFGNPFDQAFNLSRHGLYFVNDDTVLDEDALLQGDAKTLSVDVNGISTYYYDSVLLQAYAQFLKFQYNGTFTPSSLVLESSDGTGSLTLAEFRGPGSTDPNDLNYGYIRFYRDLRLERALLVALTTDSTSKDTGSIITEGGIGIEKSAYVGTNLRVLGTTDSTNVATGSAVISGGMGIAKNLHVGESLTTAGLKLSGVFFLDTSVSTTYTVADNITTVLVNDTGALGATITLPSALGSGRIIVVKDISGTASVTAIAVNAAPTQEIDNQSFVNLTTDFESVRLIDGASGYFYII